MKNKKAILYILLILTASFAGFYSLNEITSIEKHSISALNSVSDSTITKTYTCPMHPEVISDKPGDCPKCGMELELKENKEKSDTKGDVKNDNAMEHKSCKGCMHKH